MHDVPGDELRIEYSRIAYHAGRLSEGVVINGSGQFPILPIPPSGTGIPFDRAEYKITPPTTWMIQKMMTQSVEIYFNT